MLGQGENGLIESSPKPKMLGSLKDEVIRLISCGEFHMMVVTKDSGVFAWGDNKEG